VHNIPIFLASKKKKKKISHDTI